MARCRLRKSTQGLKRRLIVSGSKGNELAYGVVMRHKDGKYYMTTDAVMHGPYNTQREAVSAGCRIGKPYPIRSK